jgi:hypothetical protein
MDALSFRLDLKKKLQKVVPNAKRVLSDARLTS